MILYYLPGPVQSLMKGKLAYAFETEPQNGGCEGPDKQQGHVYCQSTDGRIGYYPERQTWKEIPHLGCHIGITHDFEPSHIARAQMLVGQDVKINGQAWHIPIARSFEEENGRAFPVPKLSRYFDVDPETGEWVVGGVQAEYQQLWDDSWRWWNIYYHDVVAVKDEDAPELDPPRGPTEQLELASRALAVNYRLGPAEIGMLKLMSTESSVEILNVTIDVKALLEISKKKAAADAKLSTDAGPQEDTQATAQLLPTG